MDAQEFFLEFSKHRTPRLRKDVVCTDHSGNETYEWFYCELKNCSNCAMDKPCRLPWSKASLTEMEYFELKERHPELMNRSQITSLS